MIITHSDNLIYTDSIRMKGFSQPCGVGISGKPLEEFITDGEDTGIHKIVNNP